MSLIASVVSTLSDMSGAPVDLSCAPWLGSAWQAGGHTNGLGPATAVFGKVGEQCVHGGIDRGVDERSPFPRERHQPRILQFLEVESESGGGQPKFLADLAGREAILAGLNK